MIGFEFSNCPDTNNLSGFNSPLCGSHELFDYNNKIKPLITLQYECAIMK